MTSSQAQYSNSFVTLPLVHLPRPRAGSDHTNRTLDLLTASSSSEDFAPAALLYQIRVPFKEDRGSSIWLRLSASRCDCIHSEKTKR
jgi:hypothetical protein